MAIYVRNQDGEMEPYKIIGLKGEDGITPNISIGTVTTLEAGEEATVTREGTNENPVFNFGIPKGESGANSSNANNASIDDTVIASDKTWSSSKIEDFVHTNDNTIWSTVQGENLSVDYTKEGYLREVEIWGNTIQNEEDLSNIQHLGELYVDEKGQPILDSENRKQYKIDIESVNKNLIDEEMEEGGMDATTGKPKPQVGKCRSVKFTRINRNTDYYLKTERYSNKAMWTGAFLYDYNFKFIKLILNNGANYVKFNSGEGMYIKIAAHVPPSDIHSVILEKGTISTNYIPHKSHKETLLLPCQLMKVGDIADRLYWDSSKGKYVIEKNIGFTNIPNVQRFSKVEDNDTATSYGTDRIQDARQVNVNDNNYINSLTKPGAANLNNKEGCISSTFWNKIAFSVFKLRLKSDTEAGFKELIPNGIDVYYVKNTPQLIETNITKEILLPSYKDKTHCVVTGEIEGSIKAKAPLDGGKAIQSLSAKNIALTLENEETKRIDKEQSKIINATILATEQMCSILEPLLSNSIENEDINPIMLNMYTTIVKQGLKTVEEIPEKYREKVDNIINNK